MELKVNEIFYSLQGEGYYTGTAAVFLRLSGCNLTCFFCDTHHHHGEVRLLDEIIEEISKYPSRHLVVTGGEPAMQLTTEMVERFHEAGFYVQIETNGTLPVPSNVDWVTCSPKIPTITAERIDELKLIFKNDGDDDSRCRHFLETPAKVYSLQPLDTSTTVDSKLMAGQLNAQTVAACVAYVKEHPQWRLSLQTHKLLRIP